MTENDSNGSTKSGNFSIEFQSNFLEKITKFSKKGTHHRRQLSAIVWGAFILLLRKTLELAAMISIDRFESARQSVLIAPFSYYIQKDHSQARERDPAHHEQTASRQREPKYGGDKDRKIVFLVRLYPYFYLSYCWENEKKVDGGLHVRQSCSSVATMAFRKR